MMCFSCISLALNTITRSGSVGFVLAREVTHLNVNIIASYAAFISLEKMGLYTNIQTLYRKQTSDSDIIEDTLPDIETDSELSKEKDVQTSINLENLKTLSTEFLINPNEMQKCLFLKNVATDSLHYTGKINHLYTMYSIST